MNSQYVQWLSGPRRGEVETAEMMQDGQTFEDVIIVSGGAKVSMSKIGKDFIVLPSAAAALSHTDLDVMYPKPNLKQNRRAQQKQPDTQQVSRNDHASILGFDPSQNSPIPRDVPAETTLPKKNNSFAGDLLSRAKKNETTVKFELSVGLPSAEFFSMVNGAFDEATVEEVMDIIIDAIDRDVVRNSIKQSIIKFYEGTK